GGSVRLPGAGARPGGPVALFWGPASPMALRAVMGIASSGPQADLGGLPLVAVYEPILIAFVTVAFAIQGLPAVVAGYRERRILRRLATTPVGPAPVVAAPLAVNLMVALAATARIPPAGRVPRGRRARLRGGAAGAAGRLPRDVCAGRPRDARPRDADRGGGAPRPYGRGDRDHAVLPADVLRRAVDTAGYHARQPAADQRLHPAGRGRPSPAGQHARLLAGCAGPGRARCVRRRVRRGGNPAVPLGLGMWCRSGYRRG